MNDHIIDKTDRGSFFSVSVDLIVTGSPIPFDLYVNSSSIKEKDKFVRIFPEGEILSKEDLLNFYRKYFQIYIPESQRNQYLKSFVNSGDVDDIKKASALKDSAIHYLDKIFDKEKEVTNELLVETIESAKESVEMMVDTIKDYNISDIQKLIGDLSFHDFYTYDHSINVSMYSISILKAVKPNASRQELVMAGLGGLLHDLGKINIPSHIINKAAGLTDEDFNEIKKHPKFGVDLLDEKVSMELDDDIDLNIVKRVVHEHHENFNGSGYPCCLSGKEIHIFARITAISDFYDAVTTKRSYHEALSSEDALELMKKSVGKKLDPQIFEIFCKQIDHLVLEGKKDQKLPDNFDPCQPHQELPIEEDKTMTRVKGDIFGKDEKKVESTAKKKNLFKKDKKAS